MKNGENSKEVKFLGNVKMEVKFELMQAVEWYIKLEEDEKQFVEETKQEMHLNFKEQFGAEKLW